VNPATPLIPPARPTPDTPRGDTVAWDPALLPPFAPHGASGSSRRRPAEHRDPDPWATRWQQIERAARLESGERLLIALSGGADSVLLLQLAAAARPRPDLAAVHVHHGLRGADADQDADFCAALCASLGVPFTLLRARIDPDPAGLEERAREARYRLLLAEARRAGRSTLLTGHHADDGLETLLMRWLRGSHLGGLAPARADLVVKGPYPGAPPEAGLDGPPVRIVRPLRTLRREEVRRMLRARGLAWREDATNADPAFARSRVRHGFLPALDEALGPGAREGLLGFAQAVERLEDGLATATAHLAWRPAQHALATRAPGAAGLGGWLPRADLAALPEPLARRALWRLLVEGTGRAPQRAVLDDLTRDLFQGRTGRRSLPAGWTLILRAFEVQLVPSARALAGHGVSDPQPADGSMQLLLPFPGNGSRRLEVRSVPLEVPSFARLCDGRRIAAEWVENAREQPFPRGPAEVELDAAGLTGPLAIRFPRPGDRFHPLGGPGSRPLVRFLADAGVPREERSLVPLVVAGDEILWVVGLRPSERRRVRPGTARRLRLALVAHGALRAG